MLLLMSINGVIHDGEIQLRADAEFQERHNKVSNEQENKEVHSGVTLDIQSNSIMYAEESDNAKRLIAREEQAFIEENEISRSGASEETIAEIITEECNEWLGKITYNFGMKPTYDGWKPEDGLDCSGFVEFIYMESGLDTDECIESTLIISLECPVIDHEELRVGDLGMVNDKGSYYTNSTGEENYTGDFDGDGEIDGDAKLHPNHVGIYLGNEGGKDIWCHCNAKDNTVVIGEYPLFTHYYRVDIKGSDEE